MSELRAIRIERGPQGFGGPLIIRPTEQKNKVMYITGGGTAPECLKKIVELSGMTPVDGFHGSAPEEELTFESALEKVQELISNGTRTADACKQIAKVSKFSKSELYTAINR